MHWVASKNNLDKRSIVPYKKRWIFKVYNIFQLDKGIRYCWLTTHIHLPFIPIKPWFVQLTIPSHAQGELTSLSVPWVFPFNMCSVAQLCPAFCDSIDCSLPDSSGHGIYPARILDCHFLLWGIFPTQGSDRHFLHCRQMLYCWATMKTVLVAQSCLSLCNPMDNPLRILCPWDSPGKNTGVSG